MSDPYDAIIIGAGHNGLVSAAYLARAGLQVLVLERRDVLGGAAATEEIFPGYQVNSGAHDAGLFRPQIVRDLELARYGLAYIESKAAAFAPDSGLTLWRDPVRNTAEVARFSTADAARFPAFLKQINRLGLLLEDTLTQTPPDLDGVSLVGLLPWLQTGLKLRRLGGDAMMEALRILPLPVKDYLDGWFESEALKGMLALPALSGGLPGPQAAGTTLMLLYQQTGGLNGGFASGRFVQGGTGRLSQALAAAAIERGAEIRTGAEVSRILVERERATGVLLSNGERITAKRVVSGADPRRTFFELLGGEHLEPAFIREVRAIRYRGATAKINLALKDLPGFGVEELTRLQGHIVVSPDMEYLERAWDDAKYGQISRRPVLDVVIPTLTDPALAPPGKHIMSITMLYAPYYLRDGHWADRREVLGDLVVQTLAAFAPGLEELVLHRQVITPLDWESAFSLTEGSIHHGQMALDQLLILRPVPGYSRYRTPIDGLYLCGAGAHPGGGVSGAPGYNAARQVLRDRHQAIRQK